MLSFSKPCLLIVWYPQRQARTVIGVSGTMGCSATSAAAANVYPANWPASAHLPTSSPLGLVLRGRALGRHATPNMQPRLIIWKRQRADCRGMAWWSMVHQPGTTSIGSLGCCLYTRPSKSGSSSSGGPGRSSGESGRSFDPWHNVSQSCKARGNATQEPATQVCSLQAHDQSPGKQPAQQRHGSGLDWI